MEQTVVGVFDSMAEARKAVAELSARGISSDRVQVSQQAATDTTTTSSSTPVHDDGVLSSIKHFFAGLFGDEEDTHTGTYAEAVRRGGAIVKVEVEGDSDELERVTEALDDAGAVDIEERSDQWRTQGWTGASASSVGIAGSGLGTSASSSTTRLPAGTAASASMGTAGASGLPSARARADSADVIPVIKEELEVGKRTVGTGAVRVFARTVETPVDESVTLRSEHAEIERRPVDRPATAADLDALRDKTIEVRETAEKAVLSKKARVVEEVSVGKRVEEREERIADSVRHTEVDVDRSAGESSFADDDSDFRSDFQTRYGSTGASYADYEPAYRFGRGLRSDARYGNREWDDIETDARRDWETRNPGSAWEKVKAAVRHAWERVTD